jgi:peptidoglycan/LPS O-acetylase OafA/YrhL
LIGLALAARFVLVVSAAHPLLVYISTPTRIDALAIGALIAVIARNPSSWLRLEKMSRWALPVAGASLAMIWIAVGSFSELHPLMQTIGFTALGILFGSLIVLAISLPSGHWMSRTLRTRVLRFFGKYSYAMYLFHLTIAQQIRGRVDILSGPTLISQLMMFGVCLAITAVAAVLSWHLFEKHFLALKRFFEDARTATAMAGPSVRSSA